MLRFRFLVLFLLLSASQLRAQYELPSNDSLLFLLKHQYAPFSQNKIDVSFELMARSLPGQPLFDSLQNVIITDAETSRNRKLMCEVYNNLSYIFLFAVGNP